MDKIEKCRATQVGRIVIHLGDAEKRVYKEELDSYLSSGWKTGVSDKHRKANSLQRLGAEPWNKGTVGVMKANSTTFKKGNVPWNKGVKGIPSWNRGLTKDTDERVRHACVNLQKSWDEHPERRKIASEVGKLAKGRKLTPEKKEIYLQKCYNTRKKHNTFNTSSIENTIYNELCEKYGVENVKRQYRDKTRYPYRCDFYVITADLFIEVNNHWTHGGRPFDASDIDCIKQLEIWKEKAKTSEFYRVAINTWTVRDVEKQNCAKQHNLNYKVIY